MGKVQGAKAAATGLAVGINSGHIVTPRTPRPRYGSQRSRFTETNTTTSGVCGESRERRCLARRLSSIWGAGRGVGAA